MGNWKREQALQNFIHGLNSRFSLLHLLKCRFGGVDSSSECSSAGLEVNSNDFDFDLFNNVHVLLTAHGDVSCGVFHKCIYLTRKKRPQL